MRFCGLRGVAIFVGCGIISVLLGGLRVDASQPDTQYANVSPLPGSGTALSADGKADGLGALQINIPIAYTPGADYFTASLYRGQYINNGHKFEFPNGTGTIGFGFGKWPRVYVSAMAVSSLVFIESKAINAQIQLVEEKHDLPALAVGVQDYLNKEWATGEAKGYYVTATKSLNKTGNPTYLTLGYGGGRFMSTFFGGVSKPLGERWNAAVEFDGYQMNEALTYRPDGRFGNLTLLGGYNNKAGFLTGANLTGKIPPKWSILTLLVLSRLRYYANK